MREHEARALALQLIDQHLAAGGEPWIFQFDNARRRFGMCNYNRKLISLSKPLTLCNEENQVRDTILHEIAHALAGVKAAHGPEWRAMAQSIGARPEPCYTSVNVTSPRPNHFAVCPGCQRVFTRYKRPRGRMLCRACREFLVFYVAPRSWPNFQIKTPDGLRRHDVESGRMIPVAETVRNEPTPIDKPVQATLF